MHAQRPRGRKHGSISTAKPQMRLPRQALRHEAARGNHGISVPPECAPLPLDPPRFCAVHESPAVQVSRTPA